MKKHIFLLLIVNCSLLIAQQPTQEWVARIPGPNNDLYGPYLAVDKQGNSYIAGTHVINDSINILCAKYSTLGVQLWATLYKYPGYGYFTPTGLALDSSGNPYVISNFALTSLTYPKGIIVKFNNLNGSPVWAKTYFGQYIESGFFDIKIDKLNNIYVVGAADSSHLVIRYNTNGDSVWVRKYHPPGLRREIANACTIDDSLNIIFTGRRIFYNPPFGYYDSVLVAKYSSSGVLRWESVYNSNDLIVNIGTKITADQNGNVYIGGDTRVSGSGVYLTLKYDRNGVRQWAKIYAPPGSGDNTIYGIAIDRMNNALFVTGYSVINSIGSAATIKYNASTGDSAWVRRGFGVSGSSSAWDVEVDSSGNAYITGSSIGASSSDVSTLKYSPLRNTEWFMTYNGTFNGGDGGRALEINRNNVYVLGYSQSSSQMSDYVLIKYNQILGVEPISNEIPKEFKLYQNYPNPFNSLTSINYQLPVSSDVIMKVYDVLGREVKELVNSKQRAGVYNIRMNDYGLSSGIYLYRLIANNKIVDVKKLIIVK